MRSSALTLGLDLGVTSVGWALANIEEQLITATGVRLYDAPINLAQFEKGELGGSHAAQRRQSRLQRRQIRRRQTRHRNLYLALQSAGMLPFAGKKAEDRHKKLEKLDIELARVWKPVMRTEAREIAVNSGKLRIPLIKLPFLAPQAADQFFQLIELLMINHLQDLITRRQIGGRQDRKSVV